MTDAPAWRERFLTAYESARTGGDTAGLAGFLADDLRLEDPQLPGGTGTKADLLRLTGDLVAGCRRLTVRRHGPLCVSADGRSFAQRWFVEAEPAAPDTGAGEPPRVARVETFESFSCAGELVTAVAIFVRDLRAAGAAGPAEPRRARDTAAV